MRCGQELIHQIYLYFPKFMVSVLSTLQGKVWRGGVSGARGRDRGRTMIMLGVASSAKASY